jgi:hypothetical protein
METNRMIRESNLDVRTITMGISLLDCAHDNIEAFNRRVYDKITEKAQHLVAVGDEIGAQYGIPIVNKRISVTPLSMAASAAAKDAEDFIKAAETLDKAAKAVGVNFIGGFSAMVQKGSTDSDRRLTQALPDALAATRHVCASVNAGSTRYGINMNAVRRLGQTVKELAEKTKDDNCIGCAKFVIFCNAVEDNPFMAGAFHGAGERDCVINVGVSGPGVVKRALERKRRLRLPEWGS